MTTVVREQRERARFRKRERESARESERVRARAAERAGEPRGSQKKKREGRKQVTRKHFLVSKSSKRTADLLPKSLFGPNGTSRASRFAALRV